ncbi:preprotein translocase subunit SecA [Leptospira sp. GIMC2001]|uniref:preprotein translocase subunit SecA n=1 Tax=Leptospira sp. GIMC2001 TaxID=1513297 RepID=UPI00234B73D9|nr:preprotein translocase subunit SecA [Leptospira sp. GIMC2001]WCL49945.1 preprotein translocase subunit SecA [Leptospira sp. GIMC2001]
MIDKILSFFLGSKHERDMKKMIPIVAEINSLEPSLQALSDEDLAKQTEKLKKRLADGQSLDDIMPEAFATVREVSVRTMGMRHFDVQLLGGIALHSGKIAEMKTGEGKTLTSTLAIYLNALAGKGVHVVTVNDYLARRDATWMQPIFDFLGIKVGIIQHDMDHKLRQDAYAADITYGTNNEYGFDYLRDNMVSFKEHKVQREHFFAIVDEVDSILIDEARTPLIISGPSDDSTDKYQRVDKVIPKLVDAEDFELDEKARSALLTESGVGKVETFLGIENLYAPDNVDLVHHVNQALKAHYIFKKDVDYVVQNGEVIIVDEFTGRLMPGRRYSDGLHQALEAKESVTIARESQTLASITFQNYFRIYSKLAGMTGTADTEAEEFHKIYGLDVVVIPPNLTIQRIDQGDRVYQTEKEKFNAIAEDIKVRHTNGQPILVGTVSIEKSETLSNLLKSMSMPHNVLNAKFHEKEAEIIANAGKPGAITIATNMAGRGTDIVLGGSQKYKETIEELAEKDHNLIPFRDMILKNKIEDAKNEEIRITDPNLKKQCRTILEEAQAWKEKNLLVKEAGGLHIIGTERHESRRIDNQLRGRSGRQGDPGSSRFYLSLNDDLMRIFGSDRISKIMTSLKMPEGQEIEHPWVSSAIAKAQKRVEGHNFDIRKHLLEYDDVMNRQRMFIYEIRNGILDYENVSDKIFEYMEEVVESQIVNHCEGNNTNSWHLEPLNEWIETLGINKVLNASDYSKLPKPQIGLFDDLFAAFKDAYSKKAESVGVDFWKTVERNIFLEILDHRWKDHLYSMDHLRDGIWAVGYGEKNPLVEYKLQGFRMFDVMVESFKNEIISFLFRVEITEKAPSQDEKKEYKKIGEEHKQGVSTFGKNSNGGMLPGSSPVDMSTKPKVTSSVSAGGVSERKSSRRNRK